MPAWPPPRSPSKLWPKTSIPRIWARPGVYLDHMRRLADWMIQIDESFEGDPNVRGSGLLHIEHASASNQRRAIEPIANRVRSLTVACLQLSMALPAQIEDRQKTVAAALSELQAALRNPPATWR